jgi:hypothetical protein
MIFEFVRGNGEESVTTVSRGTLFRCAPYSVEKKVRYLLHSEFQFAATHVSRFYLSIDGFILQEISAYGDSEGINRAWENIKNVKTSSKEAGGL